MTFDELIAESARGWTDSTGAHVSIESWSRQASRSGHPAAWTGMDRCDRPATGRAKCKLSGRPHRHCECGLPIELDHGYCDSCIAALLRGAAMSPHQSKAQQAKREAWLLRYDFIEFDAVGIRVTR